MIEGTLTINLDPPFLHFCADNGTVEARLRHCTQEDIRAALAELTGSSFDTWSIEDCIIRMRTKFRKNQLKKLKLLQGYVEPLRDDSWLRVAN